ncbi:MAG: DUF4065 domain-containing protein [Lachnospiraceae bacterium]|nr:DUF4065 domain-containing protein [Lachnospiraceae bacterium]
MRKYCEECGREVETKIVSRQETYMVCGETVEVNAQIKVCVNCGEDFYDEELDEITLLKAYNIYRQRHKLLLPEEIKEIREQYKLSQRSFAKLLNWGDKTIHRYENGSIQDKAHNSLLCFLRVPQNMRCYLSDNEVNISTKQKKELLETVDELESSVKISFTSKLVDVYWEKEPSIRNGYKRFDFDKFAAMVQYFIERADEMLKVKLMKLLNYADMIFYKENGVSISGLQYIHLPFGPVPQHYEMLFGMLEAENLISIDVQFDNGYEKHRVLSAEKKDVCLSEEEKEVLERVFLKFENFGSVEISNYSHREKGYQETKQGEVIPYSYAKDMKL